MEEETLVPLKRRDQMNMFFILYLTVLVVLLSISTGHTACRNNMSSLTGNQSEIASGYGDQFAQPLSRPLLLRPDGIRCIRP
jgi:hypothetical protein